MEPWFVIIVSLCTAAVIWSILVRPKKLPPGPSFLYSTYLMLTTSLLNFEPILINLNARYGPLFTLPIGFRTNIFVGSHSLAHQVLVQKGAVFSDRPKSVITRTIATSSYGSTWRLFRRNLASEVMHPARIRSYSWARKWVLQVLIERLLERQESEGIKVVDHFQYAMFCLLVFMCFGEKCDESKIKEIVKIQRNLLLNFASGRFSVLTLFPKLGKIVFKNRWKEFEKSRSDRDEVIVPLIKSRIELLNSEPQLGKEQNVAYVDTMVNLQLPEEDLNNGNDGRLTYMEMASMCSEFLNAGTDTTSTALQWIMANLVKHPSIQRKLYEEIVAVVGPPPLVPSPGVALESVINEEDLQKMPYLKAVVLEGLRRHPPNHFVLPHRVMKEVEVQGYTIPQGATINFMVAEMGLDPKVWDEPIEFKPERFLVNDGVFDISGSKGVKMMPFGAGRRICPGSDLALLHLEYFVANLVWYFRWTVPDGYRVDLSEKTEFTVVMKNPLRAHISSRAEK
ncbi:putative cytochrome P450 [Helianthus annuus]|uniref:cytochrome P450 89A2 n=1 Tax=Helianthus annuus TaxID=4232 RepID=UPI000B8F6B27|nr:cytochrome P450 89A2 [Helianthus annuus]KAJ0439712.1 putative cytochrome P450 [Helianthus annuus]KAJ0444905.1 putative cytochrome P450 [Helianthus annuus]KAJ0642496.1 putative cytochrome P450 [Helianthus annuus]KAJ0646371.1 putative cytochrome P450 [Helianthus annuus]